MSFGRKCIKTLGSACLLALLATSAAAAEATYQFDIPASPMGEALRAYGRTADRQLLFDERLVAGRLAPSVQGDLSAEHALEALLKGTDLAWTTTSAGVLMVVRKTSIHPQATAAAENAKPGPEVIAELVVIGSNIRGGATASPVNVISPEEIERRGLSSVPELLASLPQNFASVGAIRPQSGSVEQNGNLTYATGANLRGLGARATLTLIDGRRVAPSGAGTFFDASMLPMAALKKVEVLSDGASAIYGSDAVAGVINYVLKSPGDPAVTRLRAGAASGGYAQFDISQSGGISWNDGGLFVSVEHLENTALEQTDRAFSSGAASPASLIPRSKTNSAFAALEQELGRLRLSANVLVSDRRTQTAEIDQFQDVRKDLIAVSTSVELDLGETWRLTGAFSYSRDKGEQRFTLVPFSGAFSELQDSDGWYASLNMSGVLYDLPAGPVRAAFGLDAAQLSYLYDSWGLVLADASSRQHSAFGELLIPLLDGEALGRLSATVAARVSDYDAHGTVTNPKYGLVWEPNDQLRLRGTWGTSFKTPSLNEVSEGGMASFVSNQADPSSPTGVSRTLILTGSNPGGIDPEKSTNWTAGFDYQPDWSPGVSISGTYFDYDYRDRIDRVAISAREMLFNRAVYDEYIVDNPTVDEVLALYARSFSIGSGAGATTDPAQVRRIADLRLNNVARSKIRGLDLDLRFTRAALGGEVRASAGGTYFLQYENTPVEGRPSVPGSGVSFRPADFRARLAVGFSSRQWTADASVDVVGPYKDRLQGAPDRSVKAWAPLNLRLAYELDGATLLDGLTVALVARNILDDPPPYVRDAFYGGPLGYDTTNADPVGRFVAIDLTKRW